MYTLIIAPPHHKTLKWVIFIDLKLIVDSIVTVKDYLIIF